MAGDIEQAFLRSYKENSDALFRFCLIRLSDRELAKDLLQDVLMRAWQYLQKGNSVSDMRAFLFSVARNAIIDEYRRRKHTAAVSLDFLQEDGFDVRSGEDVLAAVNTAQDSARILARLSVLPEKYREAVYLHYIEGMSLGEVAKITGESVNNISVRIHRGLEKLRQILKDNHE